MTLSDLGPGFCPRSRPGMSVNRFRKREKHPGFCVSPASMASFSLVSQSLYSLDPRLPGFCVRLRDLSLGTVSCSPGVSPTLSPAPSFLPTDPDAWLRSGPVQLGSLLSDRCDCSPQSLQTRDRRSWRMGARSSRPASGSPYSVLPARVQDLPPCLSMKSCLDLSRTLARSVAVFMNKPKHKTDSVGLVSGSESPCWWDPSQITVLLCTQVATYSPVNNNRNCQK